MSHLQVKLTGSPMTASYIRTSVVDGQVVVEITGRAARTIAWQPPRALTPLRGQVTVEESGLLAECAAFAVDVARATAAAVVEEAIATIAPDLAPCETRDVADMEAWRLIEELFRVAVELGANVEDVEAQSQTMKLTRGLMLAAREASAAILRLRMVRW